MPRVRRWAAIIRASLIVGVPELKRLPQRHLVPALRAAMLGAMLSSIFLAGGAAAQEELSSEPVAVSDGEHLWFFEPTGSAESRRVIVLHHGPFHDAIEAAQASLTEDLPEAALAVDGRLYCFFRGRRNPDGGFTDRSVSTVRAESYNRSNRAWAYDPPQRARTVANLPGAGRIAAVAVDGRDPLVLLTPHRPLLREGESQPPDEINPALDDQLPALRRLRFGQQWESISLPQGLRREAPMTLISGMRPTLLAAREGDAIGACTAFTLGEDDQWSSQPAPIDVSRIVSATVHDGQAFLALHDPAAHRTDVVLWRHGRAYPIVQGAATTRTARLVSIESTLALADVSADRAGLVLTEIDVSGGVLGESRELRRRLTPALQDFSLLVLVGALLIATLLMFLLRPSDPSRMTVTLPHGAQIAEPRRRLAALLIDLLPAALLASLILRVPFLDVFNLSRLPMRAQHVEEALPMLLMLLLCVAHGTASEMLWGRTLGKSIMDCTVVGIDGRRASVLAIILRNALKLIALMVPVMFLMVYLNQYRQTLGDLMGRTIVIAPNPNQAPTEAPSDDER